MMASLFDSIKRLLPQTGPLASSLVQRIGLGLLVVVAVSFPLVVQTPPLDLPEGVPASRTVRAPRSVQFVDEEATEDLRSEAAGAVEPVVRYDEEIVTQAREQIARFFDFTIEARSDASILATTTPELIAGSIAARLETEYPVFESAVISTASKMSREQLEATKTSAMQLATTLMSRRMTEVDLAEAITTLGASIRSMPYPTEQQAVIAAVVAADLRPTLVVDDIASEAARKAAADEIDAVIVARQAGENIVVEGEIVTAEDLEIIKRLGLFDQSGSPASLAALVALVAFMIGSVGAFIWRYDTPVWMSLRSLAVLSSLFVGMIWVTRVLLWWRPDISIYILPVPLAAMLATLLISAREGLLTAVLSSLAAVMLGFATGDTVVATLVWAMGAVVGVSFMTDRRRLFYVGSTLVAIGALVGFVGTLAAGTPLDEAVKASGFGAIGGMLSAVLGYGLLPFFEHLFGITTDVRLLELANPAQPLLRELMTSAPGTYSHSVMTGNLAEAAAESIGANQLLARVGAYYHDVGKIRRPAFFVENQAGGSNPHDDTAPSLSALIITSHVKEGIELARKHRLPREIISIIQEHHGTSLVSYFYNKAAAGDGPVYEADFRYDGRKPQSQEAALVMLADSCEAAVRAVKKPTSNRIEATVRSVISGKVDDGQLDDSDLTLAHIESVAKVYSRMLASIYHPRIEYPTTAPRRSDHVQHPAHESS